MLRQTSGLLLFIFFMTTAAQAKNLTIIRREDNQDSFVLSPSITTYGGKSLSLQCKVTELPSYDPDATDEVLWGKRTEELEFELMALRDGRLNFSYVTESDEGNYFCISLKHELVRVVHLTVGPEFAGSSIKRNAFNWKHSSSSKRAKRFDPVTYSYDNSNYNATQAPEKQKADSLFPDHSEIDRKRSNKTLNEEQMDKDEKAKLIVKVTVGCVVGVLASSFAWYCRKRHCRPASASNSLEMSSVSYSLLGPQSRQIQGYPPSYDQDAAENPQPSQEVAQVYPPLSVPPYDKSTALFDSSPSSPPAYADSSPSSTMQPTEENHEAESPVDQNGEVKEDPKQLTEENGKADARKPDSPVPSTEENGATEADDAQAGSPVDQNGARKGEPVVIIISTATDSSSSASESNSVASRSNLVVEGDDQDEEDEAK